MFYCGNVESICLRSLSPLPANSTYSVLSRPGSCCATVAGMNELTIYFLLCVIQMCIAIILNTCTMMHRCAHRFFCENRFYKYLLCAVFLNARRAFRCVLGMTIAEVRKKEAEECDAREICVQYFLVKFSSGILRYPSYLRLSVSRVSHDKTRTGVSKINVQ